MSTRSQSPKRPLFGKPPRFFKAGSAIWLMRHHIRTRLRGKVGGNRIQTFGRNIILVSFLAFAILTLGKNIADALVVLDGNYNYAPFVLKAGAMLTAFIISLLGSSLISAYSIFSDRDDLDLLLASPLPPQRILVARMMQSAYSAFFTATLLGTIALGYSIATVDLRFALIFPVLFSFMIIDLAISFVVARFLLTRFGLRRGRTITMIIGFTILICGVLTFQINSMIGTEFGEGLLIDLFGPHFIATFIAIVTPIGHLAFGQFVPTLILAICAIGCFLGVGAFFWNRFARDAALMAGQGQHVQRTRSKAGFRFKRGLLFNTVIKEWRSMLRDPFVLVQVATPLVAILPMGIGLWAFERSGSTLPAGLLTGLIGFLAVQFGGQIAGTLGWTAASIEEAGDLLLSSPSDGRTLFWSKVLATAIPSFTFLAIAMVFVAITSLSAAFLGLGVGALGLACVGAVEFLRPRPARRAKMTQRPDRSIMSIVLGVAFSMIWAGATGMVIAGLGWWTLIPISIGGVSMAFVWATAPKSVVWMAKAPKIGAAGGPWKA